MTTTLTKPRSAKAEPIRANSPWLTIDEAAARAKVTKNTVIRWVESGTLKAHRTIRQGLTRGITRIKLNELDALLEGETK